MINLISKPYVLVSIFYGVALLWFSGCESTVAAGEHETNFRIRWFSLVLPFEDASWRRPKHSKKKKKCKIHHQSTFAIWIKMVISTMQPLKTKMPFICSTEVAIFLSVFLPIKTFDSTIYCPFLNVIERMSGVVGIIEWAIHSWIYSPALLLDTTSLMKDEVQAAEIINWYLTDLKIPTVQW